jgi:two-component system chemotaxis sensor kinase CheA
MLETRLDRDRFQISISDDGRGINWDRVKEAAYRKGLPAETQLDLDAALFADGLSTADQVTDTSGRGVGMAAVKQSCDERGGDICVKSKEGRGTTFTFKFPVESMASSTLKKLTQQNVPKPERALKPTKPQREKQHSR